MMVVVCEGRSFKGILCVGEAMCKEGYVWKKVCTMAVVRRKAVYKRDYVGSDYQKGYV